VVYKKKKGGGVAELSCELHSSQDSKRTASLGKKQKITEKVVAVKKQGGRSPVELRGGKHGNKGRLLSFDGVATTFTSGPVQREE